VTFAGDFVALPLVAVPWPAAVLWSAAPSLAGSAACSSGAGGAVVSGGWAEVGRPPGRRCPCRIGRWPGWSSRRRGSRGGRAMVKAYAAAASAALSAAG